MGRLILRDWWDHDNDVGLYFQLWIDLSHWALPSTMWQEKRGLHMALG